MSKVSKRSDIRCQWGTDYYCSGRYRIVKHDKGCPIWTGGKCVCRISHHTWVSAHRFPAFAQCSGCGHAPHGGKDQLRLVGRITFGPK